MAGKVVVEKEVVKEALAELLNKIPAFKALVSGEGSLPTRQSGEGHSSTDEGTSTEADGGGKSLLMMLKNTMACCCELGGRFLAGNLTNMTIHTKAALTNLQIQAEIKSDASAAIAGSKMVIDFGCGEHSLTV